MEAVWLYRGIGAVNAGLLGELLGCEDHHARAAATQQLRYWHAEIPDAVERLRRAANDASGIVRMEAAIAASYIGTREALEAMLEVLDHPREGHLDYAIRCALGSRTLRPLWDGDSRYDVAKVLKQNEPSRGTKEPAATKGEAAFDSKPNVKRVDITCVPERMLFTPTEFFVKPGQRVKLVFTNPDATDHNLVIVKPDALAEVGMAANEMARDPRNAASDFVPPQKRSLILQATAMIGPTRSATIDVLRFEAPREPGVYPYVCTFPGHWVVMNGVMVVAEDAARAEALLAASQPQVVKEWTMSDFEGFGAGRAEPADEATKARGMTAFVKARCNQCHVVAGHGVNLGPDLEESVKTLRGEELLRQIIEPSSKIHEKFQSHRIVTSDGRAVTGVIMREDDESVMVATNLLTPTSLTKVRKGEIEERVLSEVSPMPVGLVNVLTRDEIVDLHAYVEAGGYHLPEGLGHGGHGEINHSDGEKQKSAKGPGEGKAKKGQRKVKSPDQ
jgi:putative heme-binding domain-containing protein